MTYLLKNNTLYFYSEDNVAIQIPEYKTIHTDKPFSLLTIRKGMKLKNIPFKLNKEFNH